jgi:hypothetical protein
VDLTLLLSHVLCILEQQRRAQKHLILGTTSSEKQSERNQYTFEAKNFEVFGPMRC